MQLILVFSFLFVEILGKKVPQLFSYDFSGFIP